MITFEIDGQAVSAPAGSMVIEAADAAGIYIPRFCYHKKLSIVANCRMCLVEVEKSSKPLPACATPVAAGMKVLTRSETALKAQRAVMEFLLINHPLDCPICDQGGECELQDVAMGFGEDVSRFAEGKRVVEDEDLGALIATDMTRCIHCTRCVRFGREIAGTPELGAMGRGGHMEISTYLQKGLKTELSGNVIDVCPVGALTSKPFRFKGRGWEMQQHAGVAAHDCVGSNVSVHTIGRNYQHKVEVMRVLPKDNEQINEAWLSDRDRFSYLGLSHADRLTQPQIKQNGQWKTVSWRMALDFAVDHLGHLQKQHGGDALAAVLSPNATVEEGFLLQKLMRSLGSPHIDHRLRQQDFSYQAHVGAFPGLPVAHLAEVEDWQATLLVGSNIRHEQPLAGLRVRKSTLKGGVAMAINPIDYDFNFELGHSQVVPAQQLLPSLAAVAKAVAAEKGIDIPAILDGVAENETAQAIAKQLIAAERGGILLGAEALHHPQSGSLLALAGWIAQHAGVVMGSLTDGANSAGLWLAGAVPHRAEQAGLNLDQLWQQPRQGYILHGFEPDLDCVDPQAVKFALQSAAFNVAVTAYDNPQLRELCDVLLPMAAFSETGGTFVNLTGEWQSFKGAKMPEDEARPAWKIYRVLGNLFELDGFEFEDVQSVCQAAKEAQQTPAATWALPDSVEGLDVELMRIGQWPMYRVDPLVRRADALQASQPELVAKLHPATANALGLNGATSVNVIQGDAQVSLPLQLDEAISQGCLYLPAGYQQATTLGAMGGAVEVSV